jgi:uncharacterized protein (TIGR02996 family)
VLDRRSFVQDRHHRETTMPEPTLTAEEAALVQALAAAPDDDELRGVYADWLEENGQAERARLLRHGQRLRRLCGLAHAWVEQGPTLGYADLLFAFGLARLGQAEDSRALLDRARATLAGDEVVHTYLFGAFEYRIKQALEGKPPTGPLSPGLLERLEHLDRGPRYVVDRLRQHSYILEPDSRVDPGREWAARRGGLDRDLAALADVPETEVAGRVRALLDGLRNEPTAHEDRARILKAGLNEAPRVGTGFATELLGKVPAALDALPKPRDQRTLLDWAFLLEKALVAARFGQAELAKPLVDRFRTMLQSQEGERAAELIDFSGGLVLGNLLRLGLRDEAGALLTQMADLILEGRNVEDVDPRSPAWPKALRALLPVAGGWYALGSERFAEPVMEAARAVLFRSDLFYREQTLLAVNYAQTLGQAPVEVAQKRLEELFQKMTGIRDTYTTNQYFSLSQLDVIEAVVRAAVERGLSPPGP